MSRPAIEVRITNGGRVAQGQVERDESVRASCTLCANSVEASASITAPGGAEAFACAACLRERLDALSVARFRVYDTAQGLPWGKVSG